jgi:hypothetical protein
MVAEKMLRTGEFYLLECNAVQCPLKVDDVSEEHVACIFGRRIIQARKQHEAGSTQSWFPD